MAFDCKTESKLIHYICIYVETITMSHIYLRLYFQFIYALFVSGGKKNEQMPLTEIVCLFFYHNSHLISRYFNVYDTMWKEWKSKRLKDLLSI